MRQTVLAFAALFLLSLAACTRTGTVTVMVKQITSTGGTVNSDSVIVLLVNTANTNSVTGKTTDASGKVIFNNVANGTYKVSSDVWDNTLTRGLADSTTVQVSNGSSVTANLLLR